MRAVAYTPDLMDRSKVAAAVPGVRFVNRPGDLSDGDADLVIVDLDRPGVLEVLGNVRAARLVGFASHVGEATMSAARAAGCDAQPRSRFFRSLADLVTAG